MVESGWRAELGARTTEILGRFGVAGRVEVEGQLVWLIGHGPTVEVALPELLTTSAAQTPKELERIAERLARDLAAARRRAAGKAVVETGWLSWLKLVPPLAVMFIGAWAAVRYLSPHRSRLAPAAALASSGIARAAVAAADPSAEKHAHDYRTCLQTVTRIQQGGSVTALDTDGWVVELSLISDNPDLSPSSAVLLDYFASSTQRHRANLALVRSPGFDGG